MLTPAVRGRLNRAKRKILDTYDDDPNITGAGVGMRRRAGQHTSEPAVVVMVIKKLPEGYLSQSRLLPKTVSIDGTPVGVDVIEAGPFSWGAPPTAAAQQLAIDCPPASPIDITEKIRPLRAGSSISRSDQESAGTLSCFVLDNTDSSVCILSNRHVMGASGTVVQPGRYDDDDAEAVASVKRAVPQPITGTNVDAAIAQVYDQTEDQGWTREVARDMIPPISARNPGVGLVTIGDIVGNILITRLDATARALNVTPIISGERGLPNPGEPLKGVVAPEVGMDVEKVGRTTGYTSGIITLVDVEINLGVHRYYDLAFVPFFGLSGDSGSLVIQGASYPCPVLGITGDYYGLDLQKDRIFTDRISREFMSQTRLGRFLASLPYLNVHLVKDRLGGKTGTPDEQQTFQHFYDKYRDFIIGVLDDPNSSEVVTQEHLDDIATGIGFLEQSVLNESEAGAAWQLYNAGSALVLGKNRWQLLDFMGEELWRDQVMAIIMNIKCIQVSIIDRLGMSNSCPVLRAVGSHYGLPLTDDVETTDKVKREFFSQTPLGQLLNSLPYVNAAEITSRMTFPTQPDEIANAQQYYEKYHDFMVGVLDDPTSSEVVTQEHLDDAAAVIDGLSQTVLYAEEINLAWLLYDNALSPTLGMTRAQISTYMDDPDLYKLVYDGIAEVPTIQVIGPITFPPGLEELDPIGWWKLDGNGSDGSGNRPLTAYEQHSWITGKIDGALRLSGGWAATAQPVVDITQSFTVTTWARLDESFTSEQSFPSLISQDGFDISFAPDIPEQNYPMFWSFNLNATAYAFHGDPFGTWTHVAGVYDAEAQTIQLYINGQAGYAGTLDATVEPRAGGLHIGTYAPDSGDPVLRWPGDIDDVRVFAQALRPWQIAQLSQLPLTSSSGPAT